MWKGGGCRDWSGRLCACRSGSEDGAECFHMSRRGPLMGVCSLTEISQVFMAVCRPRSIVALRVGSQRGASMEVFRHSLGISDRVCGHMPVACLSAFPARRGEGGNDASACALGGHVLWRFA
jgi:hypothetical protein